MLNLVRKDIRASALHIGLIMPVMLLTSFGGLRGGQLFFWWAMITAAVVVAAPVALEWNEGAGRFLHSLPVSRREVVTARYVTSVVLTGASVAMLTLVVALAEWYIVSRGGAWPGWMCLETALAFIIVASVAVAIFLPCVFRFGFGVGSGAFGAIVIVGVVVLENISASLYGQAVPASARAGAVSTAIPGGISARMAVLAVDALGAAGGAIAIMVAALAVLLVSMRLSMRLHDRSEF